MDVEEDDDDVVEPDGDVTIDDGDTVDVVDVFMFNVLLLKSAVRRDMQSSSRIFSQSSNPSKSMKSLLSSKFSSLSKTWSILALKSIN